MKFEEDNLYHIYNRGNNKQQIFFNAENYLYFLYKMRAYLRPHCDILAYCLMPNHFHFLINTNNQSVITKTVGSFEKNVLSEGIRILLSSYTQAINKQEKRVGSLFTQNTKCKCLTTNILKNGRLGIFIF
jgi:putative transposase